MRKVGKGSSKLVKGRGKSSQVGNGHHKLKGYHKLVKGDRNHNVDYRGLQVGCQVAKCKFKVMIAK